MNAADRSRLLAQFTEDSWEDLENLEQNLLALELNPSDKKVLEEIGRALHTLKGSSNMMGFDTIGRVCHLAEDLLESIVPAAIQPSAAILDTLFDVVDWIKVCLGKIEGGDEDMTDAEEICTQLATLLGGETAATDPATVPVETATVTVAKPVENEPDAPAVDEREETVRVRASRVDEVIRLAGEATLGGTRLVQRLDTLAQIRNALRRYLPPDDANKADLLRQTDTLYQDLREGIAGLNQTATELQESALDLRMLPVSTIFDRFPRAVRDLAHTLGKEVDLEIRGAQTQLDKKVIEKLDAIMVHLLRNAVDHGLEPPQERQQAGKATKGTLSVSADYRGNHVEIVVSDDGRGIDRQAIKEKALRRGLVDATTLDNASDRDLLDLVFRPAFSTAAIITDVSGRGVGMDVVKRGVEELKGQIYLESELGRGTRCIMRLPTTLATLRAMFVQAGTHLFALPMGSIVETFKIASSDLIDVVDYQAVRLRDQVIPLFGLDETLELPKTKKEDGEFFVVITRAGAETVGFGVDALVDERDVLVKALPQHLQRIPCIEGVSLFRDNHIALVLHVPDLIAKVRHRLQTQHPNENGGAQDGGNKRILVVDDSHSTREIEKRILEDRGYSVDLAADGREALERALQHPYDLVVTDVEMPHMDGFTLVEHLRNEANYRQTPLVIMTSRAEERDKERGIELGADAYIVKGSFEQTMLIEAVDSLID